MGLYVEIAIYLSIAAVVLPTVAVCGLLAYVEAEQEGLVPDKIQCDVEIDDWVSRRWD